MSEADRDAMREIVEEVVREQIRASRGLLNNREIANYLGVGVRRWQEMCRERPKLMDCCYEIEEGEGAEQRWDLAEVLKLLRRRRRR